KFTWMLAPQNTVTVCCRGKKSAAEAVTSTPVGVLSVPTCTGKNTNAPDASVAVDRNCCEELTDTVAPAIGRPVTAFWTLPEIVAPVHTLIRSMSTVEV